MKKTMNSIQILFQSTSKGGLILTQCASKVHRPKPLSQEVWMLGNFAAVAIFPRKLGHYMR